MAKHSPAPLEDLAMWAALRNPQPNVELLKRVCPRLGADGYAEKRRANEVGKT